MPIVGQFGSLAGLGSLILPGGAMESIATVTVGSGGASSIEFTSIPGTFQHLQVRLVVRDNASQTSNAFRFRINNNSTSSNYITHRLYGDGATAYADSVSGISGGSALHFSRTASNTATASVFGAAIVDVLDYSSTSKTTTVRSFGGCDLNGSGFVMVESGLFTLTDAVTSIQLLGNSTAAFSQYSTFALYGLRAP